MGGFRGKWLLFATNRLAKFPGFVFPDILFCYLSQSVDLAEKVEMEMHELGVAA
jgi:hypothetical protein